MSDAAIAQVSAWEAMDSRGRPTVACRVQLAGGASGRAVVPSGASTGGHEAHELRDGGARYGGYGVSRAVANVETIVAPAIIGMDAADRVAIDEAMEKLDTDAALSGIGANAVLAASLAVTLAHADAVHEPLWRVLAGGGSPLIPLPMINIISGGAHAQGALDIQDILVVPVGASSFTEALEWVWRVRRAASELLDARGGSSALVADEGGLASAFATNEAAVALVAEAISTAGLQPHAQMAIAIDIAANQISAGARYRLSTEGRSLDTHEWLGELASWCSRYPIVSLEDVLVEDDWNGWQEATILLGNGRQLLGDDLFATNEQRLTRGIDGLVANAVLVKPNQAGTVSRAEAVVRTAHAAGYSTVVSARSGDTEDSWLADFSVGWRAGQIKVGSTHRSERTSKWNRLLEIEKEAGATALFAGRAALGGQR